MRRRQGAQAPAAADGLAAQEAVVVLAPRREARNSHVHGVGALGARQRGTAARDARKGRVLGDLPVHCHRRRRHAAVRPQRLRCQTRPQHRAVGGRIAAGHTQAEGIVGPARRRQQALRSASARQCRHCDGAAQPAAADGIERRLARHDALRGGSNGARVWRRCIARRLQGDGAEVARRCRGDDAAAGLSG